MSSSDESGREPSAEGTEGAKGTEGTEGTEPTDTKNVGGFGELVPDPLRPVWRRVESVQGFRRTHGNTYVTVLEAILAAVLTGGYLYWLFLFLTG